MPIALKPGETWRFQLHDDYAEKPGKGRLGKMDPDGTIFALRSLPQSIVRRIRNLIEFRTDERGQAICQNRGDVIQLAWQYGVESIENFRDADGNLIEVTSTKDANGLPTIDTAIMDRFSQIHQAEVCNAVTDGNTVTAAEQD